MSQSDLPLETIGPYRLIKALGEGGMGIVYQAEQTGAIKRTVALKLIKPGMDSKQVIARFEAERQALASMDHPYIASVHDAGTTSDGRLYFCMEYVDGAPITEYCAKHRLNLVQRLALFVQLCDGLQHAHQKGIIHRDLKPSNLLIIENDQGHPHPKIIDFGIAKATQGPLTEHTLVTSFSQIIGTPAYMSPEQADMTSLDVDTRADIYGLGVLLYELVTGHLPIDRERLESAAMAEVQRLLWEEEPPRPSKRLTSLGAELESLSADQGMSPAKLIDTTQGDLDWIIMKAIDKDRTRRYGSASGFAEDLQRFLNDEPVSATPPSPGYLIGKFVRRHRAAVFTTVLTSLLLICATTVSVWLAIRASRAEARESSERLKAETQAAIAEETVDFLKLDLLLQASPNQQPNPDVRLRTVLDRAAEALDERFDDRPLVKAQLLITVGQTYNGLGEYEVALDHLRRGYDIWVKAHGATDRVAIMADMNIGECLRGLGDVEGAMPHYERSWRARVQLLGKKDPATLRTQASYASNLKRAGRVDEAIALLEEAKAGWALYDDAYLREDRQRRLLWRWTTDGSLGDAYHHAGQLKRAEAILKESYLAMREEFGMDSIITLTTMANYAAAIGNQGRLEEALPVIEACLEAYRKILGLRSPRTLKLMHDVGGVNWAVGNRERGLAVQREVYTLRLERFGLNHQYTLQSAKQLGDMLFELGNTDDYLGLAREILPAAYPIYGGSHEITNWAYDRLAEANDAGLDALLDEATEGEIWPEERTEVIVPEGASWHYNDTTVVGSSWQEMDFDHAEWPVGQAPLGYGEDDIVTTLDFGENPDQKHPSACFRLSFEVHEQQFEKLRLKIRCDDGAGVFLNGQWIAGKHVSEGLSLDQFVDATVGGLEERVYESIRVDPGALVSGTNVLAVQAHQCNGGSSDFLFDLALEGLKHSLPE